VTVNIVYGDPPLTPGDADTINLNPRTGDWDADAADTYDITYTYGDYTTALQNTAPKDVRYIGVCTESDTVKTTAQTEVADEAANLDFKRVITGSRVDLQSSDISGYTPNTEDWRLIEVAPARGTMSAGEVRTVGAMLGTLAQQPIDPNGSPVGDSVGGLSDVNVAYRDSEADNFQQVTSIGRDLEIVAANTTSSDTELQPIYKAEILDLIVETMGETADLFLNGPNTAESKRDLRAALRRVANGLASSAPPVLGSTDGGRPYNIAVDQGGTDTNVDATIAVEPTPIMRSIDLNFNFGAVTTFEGVN